MTYDEIIFLMQICIAIAILGIVAAIIRPEEW